MKNVIETLKQLAYIPVIIVLAVWFLFGFTYWYLTGGPQEFDFEYQMHKHGLRD